MERYKSFFYLALVALSVYAVAYQVKANREIVGDQRAALKDALRAEPAGHAMIMINESLLTPYAHAQALAAEAPEREFWLVAWDLDPAIILNYHTYPKIMRMSEATQMQLHAKNLLLVRDDIEHFPPKAPHDKVAIIEEKSARLDNEWAGNQ